MPTEDNMKNWFFSTCSSQSKARIGQITRSKDSKLVTPAVISYARRGAIPFLTPDNVRRLPIDLVHLSMEHLLDVQPPVHVGAPFSLAKYLGLHSKTSSQKSIMLSLRDPTSSSSKTSFNSDKFITVQTARGLIQVTPEKFAEWTIAKPPDFVLAFADDPLPQPNEPQLSKKRLYKSVTRSAEWASEVVSKVYAALPGVPIFVPLVGSSSMPARADYAARIEPLSDSISGYVLDVETALPTPEQPLSTLFNHSLEKVSEEKARMCYSASGPHEILHLIKEVGVDLFLDDWSSACSAAGCALDFEFPVSLPTEKRNLGYNLFFEGFVEDFSVLSSSPLAAPEGQHPFGNAPLTKAYVHHLLVTHEMSAHIALAMHNTVVMSNFMKQIQLLLRRNDGSFEEEMNKFFNAYEGPVGGLFSLKEHAFLEDARVDLLKVEKARGKGSSIGRE